MENASMEIDQELEEALLKPDENQFQEKDKKNIVRRLSV